MPDPSDLITSAVATAALTAGGITLTTAQTAYLPSAITAASKAIARYCSREFVPTDYDEVYIPRAGQWDRGEPDTVMLRTLPINSLSRVAGSRTTALTITNTDTSTNQRATVTFTATGDPTTQLTFTGLTLSRTASGVTTTSPLLFTDYVTVTALANAITALANGWTASVSSGYGLYASADLFGSTGPINALGSSNAAPISIFATDLTDYAVDFRTGVMTLFYDIGSSTIDNPFFWPGFGVNSPPGAFRSPVRVSYNAGFTTIPGDLQNACCEVVKNILERLTTDSTLQSESDGAYTYTAIGPRMTDMITQSAKQLLAQYRMPSA